MVQGNEEEPGFMRCAALHCPWGYTSHFGLGQRSELVPGSTDIPARPIAPSHRLLLSTLPVIAPPLKSPSLFNKLTQCSHKQEHPWMAAEQALGCPGAELRLLLMLQKPPGCSSHLLEYLALWCTGNVPGRGTWCQCWLLAAFPPPPLPARRRTA